MDKVRIFLFMTVFLAVGSIGFSAEEVMKTPESVDESGPEYEMVEIARISIVPDAAWRCDKAFDPPVLTVKAGTTVVWTNLDRETHSLISSTGSQPCYLKADPIGERAIQMSQLPHNGDYRKEFDTPGEYQYSCHLPSHHMAGKIVVVP